MPMYFGNPVAPIMCSSTNNKGHIVQF